MPSLGRILERLTVAVDGDTSDAERKLHGISDESKGGSWVGKLGSASTKAGGLMALGIGSGILAMGGIGIAAAAQSEQSNIAFTSIMGDAGKAKAFLADLNKFAAETPFELPGLRDSASQMLAVGVQAKDVIPIMRTLGDSTAAMGTGEDGIRRAVLALTQMQVKGKVTGEEMLQLAEAGVPAWDALATKMGVSVPEAQAKVSAGQVQVNTLMAAIETSAGPALGRVKGMMDKQSQSASGLWSTLKDTVTQGLGTMMGPALEALKGAMPQITTLMGGLFTTMGPAIAQLIPSLVSLFKSFVGVLPGMFEGISKLLPVVTKVFDVFSWLLKTIPPQVIVGLVGAFMLFGPVSTVFSVLAAVLPVLGAGFSLLLGPVGLVILAVAGLAAAGYLIYRNWDSIAAFFVDLWDTVSGAFLSGVDSVVGFLTSLPGRALDAILALPGLLGSAITETVRLMLLAWYDLAFGIPKAIVSMAPAVIGAWFDMQMWLARTAWDGLQEIVGFFVRLPGWAVGALANLGPALANVGWNAAQAMYGSVVAVGDRLWRFFVDLPGNLVAAVSTLPGLLWNVGRDAVLGLWHGIEAMGAWLKSVVWGWVKDVLPGPVKDALGISSPSKVMAWHGRMAAAGLAEGILGGTDVVAAASRTLAGAASLSPSFASSTAAGIGLGTGGTTVVVSLDGMTMTVDELKRRMRVLFIDDGGRNAFAAAVG